MRAMLAADPQCSRGADPCTQDELGDLRVPRRFAREYLPRAVAFRTAGSVRSICSWPVALRGRLNDLSPAVFCECRKAPPACMRRSPARSGDRLLYPESVASALFCTHTLGQKE